jgi:hypothetical protein
LGALYLLPLGLAFDLVGYLPPYLRLFYFHGLLLVPLCLRPSKRSAVAAGLLLALAGVRLLGSLPVLADLTLMLLAHQLVWAMAFPISSRFNAGVLFYAFLHAYLFQSSLGHPVAEAWARLGCQWSGGLTGSTVHLGPTYQNLGGILLLLCLSIFGWEGSRGAKARTASFLLVTLLLAGLMAFYLTRRVDFGADLVWNLKFREVFGCAQLFQKLRGLLVVVYPGLMFAAYLAVYLVLHHEAWQGSPALPRASQAWGEFVSWARRSPHVGAMLVVSLAFLWIAMPPTSWRRPSPLELVFIERGVVSFTKPDYTRFGKAAGGMYGMLPEYARLFGCPSTVVREVPETLRSDQVVVFTNLDEPLPPEVFRRVWDFVAAGGRLWVLGDHTFIKNGRNHLNDLLAPCHIRFNHDSAQFFPQGWFHSYRFFQGTPFGGLSDLAENRPAILVGASLDLRVPAQPFIQGRFGYSDWGTSGADDKQGYIGDFKYQPQERLGDLVLVAGERYGQGRVLVFGDTTSFFNNNLSRSFELLRAVLSWLGDSPRWLTFAGWTARLVVVMLLLALGVLTFLLKSNPAVAVILAGSFVAGAWGHRTKGWLAWDAEHARRHLAIIDFSHHPYTSKHSSTDLGLHGVAVNLMRYGMLPVALNDWDRTTLEQARLLVMNAPRRPFGARHRGDVRRFLERGGTVWWGCGHAHYEFSRSVLESLQARVRPLPLGRFFDRTAFGQRISFVSAWPIEVDAPEASAICLYDEWPLIVLLPVGQGRLVLIGDSEFLHNRNLEGFENYDPANIQFIRALLDYTVGGGGA